LRERGGAPIAGDVRGSSSFQPSPMQWGMRRDRTLEKIVEAFAEAVAEYDFDAAEGWFATARLRLAKRATRGAQIRQTR
jgi:hypothetical protein